MTRAREDRIRRYIRGQLAVTLLLALAIYAQSYAGRIRIVDAQRAACHRQILRDYNAAIAWSVAAAQRRITNDVGTARAYEAAAGVFWRYAATNCDRATPAASPLGL